MSEELLGKTNPDRLALLERRLVKPSQVAIVPFIQAQPDNQLDDENDLSQSESDSSQLERGVIPYNISDAPDISNQLVLEDRPVPFVRTKYPLGADGMPMKKQRIKKSEKKCESAKLPLKHPITGNCISTNGEAMKTLYAVLIASRIKDKYEEDNKNPEILKSIDGANKILAKYTDDELKRINNFILRLPNANIILKSLNKCNRIADEEDRKNYVQRINKNGALICMPKQTRKEQTQKHDDKLATCDDYVYSSKLKLCIKKDGKLYETLGQEEKDEAATRNCKYTKVAKKDENGKIISVVCKPGSEKAYKELRAKINEWDPEYDKPLKGEPKKRVIKKGDKLTRSASSSVEQLKNFMKKNINLSDDLNTIIEKIKQHYQGKEIPEEHVTVIRNYLVSEAAYLALKSPKLISPSLKKSLSKEAQYVSSRDRENIAISVQLIANARDIAAEMYAKDPEKTTLKNVRDRLKLKYDDKLLTENWSVVKDAVKREILKLAPN